MQGQLRLRADSESRDLAGSLAAAFVFGGAATLAGLVTVVFLSSRRRPRAAPAAPGPTIKEEEP